ncbi:MAG: MiaB/RimO family radical SAM methylthiotransferase [Rickettsiales bacterium]|jgi:threonylcarbamoyladenosine tRNA methylthiotransferase MtaB|nr:MiaB/RimO family radical SAM methylthiotransferase [Rickettsiales bacterium]
MSKNQVINFGCRLNALESEKIRAMLSSRGLTAGPWQIVVNTCAVTSESERQCRQAVRRIVRENPDTRVFVTGCAATLNPDAFPKSVTVISNADKMNPESYGIKDYHMSPITNLLTLSKGFVQVQNGCNHKCAYCIVSKLRGRNVSFPYERILADTRALCDNGYGEIVLTGVDIAGYGSSHGGELPIAQLCRNLLRDVPKLRRLRLSSMDPAVPMTDLIDLMHSDTRMMPHLHLSMQSGCDEILRAMGRRHNADMVRGITCHMSHITSSWDMICGFPGETDEMFDKTCALVRELKPIHIHAFPFSPRPGTVAATMPGQIPRAVSKQRVKILNDLARENRIQFMRGRIGQTTQVLMEENNIARDEHDIECIMTPLQNKPSKTGVSPSWLRRRPSPVESSDISRDSRLRRNDAPLGRLGEVIPAREILDVRIIGVCAGARPHFVVQKI